MLIFLCCFDGMYDYFFRLHGVLNFSDVPSVTNYFILDRMNKKVI